MIRKIAIIEDHPLMADGLKTTLESIEDVEVVGVYPTGQSFLSDMAQILPDLVLLDYHLPDITGAVLCRQLRAMSSTVKVLVLTGFEKPALASEMLESGCSGYLLKSFTNSHVLREAIHRLSLGEIYLDSHLPGIYARQLQEERNAASVKLTSREMEVLKEVVNGLSSKEISEKLFISKRTVENHRNSIMIKTSSKNLASLIRFTAETGLL